MYVETLILHFCVNRSMIFSSKCSSKRSADGKRGCAVPKIILSALKNRPMQMHSCKWIHKTPYFELALFCSIILNCIFCHCVKFLSRCFNGLSIRLLSFLCIGLSFSEHRPTCTSICLGYKINKITDSISLVLSAFVSLVHFSHDIFISPKLIFPLTSCYHFNKTALA